MIKQKIESKQEILSYIDELLNDKNLNYYHIKPFFRLFKEYFRINRCKVYYNKDKAQKLTDNEKNMVLFFLNNATLYKYYYDEENYSSLNNKSFFENLLFFENERFFNNKQRLKLLRGVINKWLT